MHTSSKKQGRTLHTTIDLERRVNCSAIYPILAPNGSTLIITGHEHGLHLIWRGGRKRRQQESGTTRASKRARTGEYALDDEEEDAVASRSQKVEGDDVFEADELDPDCPCPSVIRDVEVDLDAEVLCIAIPTAGSSQQQSLRDIAIIAVTLEDGSLKLLSVPLAPPEDEKTASFVRHIHIADLDHRWPRDPLPSLAVRILPDDDSSEPRSGVRVCVAVASVRLSVLVCIVNGRGVRMPHDNNTCISLDLPSPALLASFADSKDPLWLQVADRFGVVRIFEVLVARKDISPQDSISLATSYLAPFKRDPSGSVRRKRILASAWVMQGDAVVVLLEDGEWALWVVRGSLSFDGEVHRCMLGGILGSPRALRSHNTEQRRPATRLAPMTPNTRRAKAETLFSGPAKVPGMVAAGGVSVTARKGSSGAIDSIVMWYCDQAYCVPNLQRLIQRYAAVSGHGKMTVSNAGMIQLTEVTAPCDRMVSVSPFSDRCAETSGSLQSTAPDLLVSSEYRLHISERATAALDMPVHALATKLDSTKATASGPLALGAVDEILDKMANKGGRSRRVGFVHWQ